MPSIFYSIYFFCLILIDTAPPGPPVNVVAMVMSYDVINLQWDAPHTPSPVIYLVEWGTNESHLNQVSRFASSKKLTNIYSLH